jgi:predicted DNA-binding ArsR family transcriptional regulator
LYGEDIIDAINDPEKQEEIAAANKEYMDRVSQEEEYSKQYETNLAQSLEELSKIQQEQGLSDVEIDETMSELMTIVKDAILGKFSRSTIEMMLKGKSHDNDVATASNEGEIRGRNQRIEEKLRKPQDGDGTKVLDGMNTQAPQRVKRRTIFDDAREAQ